MTKSNEFQIFLWRPPSAPRKPTRRPRGPQEGFLALQDGPKTTQRRPQDAPKMSPKSASKAALAVMGAQTPSKLGFWIVLGWILKEFGFDFGRFLASLLEGFDVDVPRMFAKQIFVWLLFQLEK